MQWGRPAAALAFSVLFVGSCFTNKFVLSVLKFTFPTLFQGWQTFVGALLLLLCGKLGWVEMSRITRSAALSWLPGSLMFLGNIYAGSRALSHMDVPLFFTIQNSSHAVSCLIQRVVHREQKMSWTKLFSLLIMLMSALNLPLYDPGFDQTTYMWAVGHLSCVGAYRVFRIHFKSNHLSDIEQQCINYMFSVLLLAMAAHPTGDLLGALEFPFLHSYTFHWGCCASALLGFLLLLATVQLNSSLSTEHCRVWVLLSKAVAVSLSPLVFHVGVNAPSLLCHVGEVLLVFSEREAKV